MERARALVIVIAVIVMALSSQGLWTPPPQAEADVAPSLDLSPDNGAIPGVCYAFPHDQGDNSIPDSPTDQGDNAVLPFCKAIASSSVSTQRRERDDSPMNRHRASNQLGHDDEYTEGDVIAVVKTAAGLDVTLGMRDGQQIIHLACADGCPTIRTGDYVTASGVKETEQEFVAEQISVEH